MFNKDHIFLIILLGLFCFNGNWTKSIKLYNLDLTVPEMSERHEIAELRNADTPNAAELVVIGNNSIVFTKPGEETMVQTLITTYVADKNGYRAKFSITSVTLPKPRLGVKTLKLTIGSSAKELKLPNEIEVEEK